MVFHLVKCLFFHFRYAMALYNQHVCPVNNWYVASSVCFITEVRLTPTQSQF